MFGIAVAIGLLSTLAGCRVKEAPPIREPFADAFERDRIGDDWRETGSGYVIRGGQLVASGAYNHPLWLRRPLPDDVTIELDVEARSPTGDIKVELYGDGASFDPDRGGYVSSGYVLIFGGWRNSLSVICKHDEHDQGRKAQRTDRRVEPGRKYHFTITRTRGQGQQGEGKIDWRIDGEPFLTWNDPQPLAGSGHRHFALNNWEAEVAFDNLNIRPAQP